MHKKLKDELANFTLYTEILEEIDDEDKQELPQHLEGDNTSEDDDNQKEQLQSKMRQLQIQKEQQLKTQL